MKTGTHLTRSFHYLACVHELLQPLCSPFPIFFLLECNTFAGNIILKFAQLILDDISGWPYKLSTMLTLHRPFPRQVGFLKNLFSNLLATQMYYT